MADSEVREQELEGADDQILSMVDVLNDEQQLQDDANAVLGPCDDNICTYSQVVQSTAMMTKLLVSLCQLFK